VPRNGIVVLRQITDEKRWLEAMRKVRQLYEGQDFFKDESPSLFTGRYSAISRMLSQGDLGLLCELRRHIPMDLVQRIVESTGAQNPHSDLSCLPLLELTEDLNFGNSDLRVEGGPGTGIKDETRWTVFDADPAESSLKRMEESLEQSRAILGQRTFDPWEPAQDAEEFRLRSMANDNVMKKAARIKAARKYADVKKKFVQQTKKAGKQALPCNLLSGQAAPAGSNEHELNNDLVEDYHAILESTMADLPHISDPDAFKRMHGPPTLFSFNATGGYPPVLYQTLPLLGRHFRGLRRNYGNYEGANEHGDRLAPAIQILLEYFPEHLRYEVDGWDDLYRSPQKPPKAGDLEERALVYDRVYEAMNALPDLSDYEAMWNCRHDLLVE
jgi:hypothetical protein